MKVLFVTSEAAPFAKTGGLGDVCGALPAALAEKGVDVRVIMPKYGRIAQQYKDQMRYITHIYIKMGWRNQYCGVFSLEHNGVTFYFVDNEFYFGGFHVYGAMYEDIERFIFFSKAVLALIPQIDFRPDVMHLNDWQSAVIPVLVDSYYKNDNYYQGIKTVLTIHNLKFQGVYGIDTVADLTDLPKEYFTTQRLEFYRDANLLKGGLLYSDFVTTVSPTYAGEIKTPYYGEGLDGVLTDIDAKLLGILNGIDTDEYNPATDTMIDFCYDKRNFVSKKKLNKLALQKDLGLEENDGAFLVGMVTRLSPQKGIDLIEQVAGDLFSMEGAQFVILGTGEQRYENMLRYYAHKYPGKVSAQIKFDNWLSHKIYAASDAFFMPSAFEPCGLAQMIAMRYGTLPIVRETGGLKDTVVPYNKFTKEGTGFSFRDFNAYDMLFVLKYAQEVFANKAEWNAICRQGMSQDFSWTASAQKYLELYEKLLDED